MLMHIVVYIGKNVNPLYNFRKHINDTTFRSLLFIVNLENELEVIDSDGK